MNNQRRIQNPFEISKTERFARSHKANLVKWLTKFVYELSGCGFESRCCHLNLSIAPNSSNEFLDVQVTIECRFTQKLRRDMRIAYSH